MRVCVILLYFLLYFCSCSIKNEPELPMVSFMDDSVKLLGTPDSTVLSKFINGEVHCTYLLNNMVTMILILENPAIYHCFIFEQVGTDKQIYYLKIDDALKYNWIPYYDSLAYDLKLNFFDTEMTGCTIKNNNGGNPFIFSDTPKHWSSKFEIIHSMRNNSEYYHKIISQCDDAAELSEYYNNSLFFQNKNYVRDEDKMYLLTILLMKTQISYTENFFELDRDDFDLIYYIVDNNYSGGLLNFRTYKISDFNKFKDDLIQYHNEHNKLDSLYRVEHLRTDHRRYVSRYILDMSKDNLNNLLANIENMEKLYKQSTMMIYQEHPHHDLRVFFFNIKYDENNKITIEKNYYNKEYITTSRIRGYY